MQPNHQANLEAAGLSNGGQTLAYAANRSPTGHATSLLVTLESGVWGFISEGRSTRVALAPGEPLYASDEDAVLAARYRWRCNGRRPRGARPTPIATVGTSAVLTTETAGDRQDE